MNRIKKEGTITPMCLVWKDNDSVECRCAYLNVKTFFIVGKILV